MSMRQFKSIIEGQHFFSNENQSWPWPAKLDAPPPLSTPVQTPNKMLRHGPYTGPCKNPCHVACKKNSNKCFLQTGFSGGHFCPCSFARSGNGAGKVISLLKYLNYQHYFTAEYQLHIQVLFNEIS